MQNLPSISEALDSISNSTHTKTQSRREKSKNMRKERRKQKRKGNGDNRKLFVTSVNKIIISFFMHQISDRNQINIFMDMYLIKDDRCYYLCIIYVLIIVATNL